MNQDDPIQNQSYVVENELSTNTSSIDNNRASLKSMDDIGTDGTNRWDYTSTDGKGESSVIAAANRFPDSINLSKQNLDNERGEKMSNNSSFDLLFKELKDDMREREQRSEKRFEVQQELLLNQIDKKMDNKLNGIEKQFESLNEQIKNTKNENRYWFIGLIVAIIGLISPIIVALINILPQMMK